MIHNLLLPIGITIDWLHEHKLIHNPSIRDVMYCEDFKTRKKSYNPAQKEYKKKSKIIPVSASQL